MREDVDRSRLEEFLEELGRTFRGRARLVLCGGETFVWRGLRGATRDIHVAYDVSPANHGAWIAALVALKERLSVNVEEAQPGDFVPLPPGAEGRAEFIGRYGAIDAFLCDPYSIAMAKLDRGAARDLADVRALLSAGVLEPARLRELVQAAIASDSRPRLRFDPARVARDLDEVLEGE